jgi:iron complex outermembrane receptor protein
LADKPAFYISVSMSPNWDGQNKVGKMKTSFVSRANRVSLMLGVALGAVAMSQPAFAQDAAEEEPAVEEEAAPASDAIVVTGSRIRSVTPFNSPDPIAVLDPEVAKKEGRTDLASTLQGSSIAAGSTQVTAALSSNFVTNGGPGAQTIDLRGLGANRTLVLLNGRRAGPAGTRGGVSSFDLNVLPLSIVSDIQILKTGASSVYGSDAVAGVVNIFTKTKMDGLRLDLNASVPFDSGGGELPHQRRVGQDLRPRPYPVCRRLHQDQGTRPRRSRLPGLS